LIAANGSGRTDVMPGHVGRARTKWNRKKKLFKLGLMRGKTWSLLRMEVMGIILIIARGKRIVPTPTKASIPTTENIRLHINQGVKSRSLVGFKLGSTVSLAARAWW
jgi:hypothetical protein